MSNAIRHYVAKRLADAVQSVSKTAPQELTHLSWCVRFAGIAKNTKNGCAQLSVAYKDLQACKALICDSWKDQLDWATSVAEKFPCDDVIQSVQAHNNALHIDFKSSELTQSVLRNIAEENKTYGQKSVLHLYRPDSDGHLQPVPQGENVLVEYSSPNIAKPFHAGHLRSTIIGNFVANINKALSHNVIRVNYLGDWGTQFGLLSVGYQKYASESKMKTEAMKHLFQVYVKISQDAKGECGEAVQKEGMEFFCKMEQGDPSCLALWRYCRDRSIKEYAKVYERLGVNFDEYEGESQYQVECSALIASMQASGLLRYHSDPPVGYVDLSSPQHPSLYVNVIKSDGTTLYITRDIAAAISRHQRFQCDRFHYVVENGQHQHFVQLLGVLDQLGHRWAARCSAQWHVKFGRVDGMSTRRGQVVFLEDILDEAKNRMKENMEKSNTTKVQGSWDQVADRLGVSAVIVQDLKQHRQRNYKFSWQRALNFKGDTGVSLQYAHARLCSLEKTCQVPLNFECALHTLTEPAAVGLARHLARYDVCLQNAFTTLEACQLVGYLFRLSHLINEANLRLRVKGEQEEVAQARLLLFHCARTVLANGLQLLGISPLEEM